MKSSAGATHFLASWKIFSSSQSGLAASISCARLLCSRASTVVIVRSKGFWLTLAFPDSLQHNCDDLKENVNG